VRFWIEIEVMSFYHVILVSIAFLILSTFLQAKLPDPKNLLKNYDYLELVVAENSNKLTQAIMLETFPGIMFIFTVINKWHQGAFAAALPFDFYYLLLISALYLLTFYQAIFDTFHIFLGSDKSLTFVQR